MKYDKIAVYLPAVVKELKSENAKLNETVEALEGLRAITTKKMLVE